MHRGGDTSAYNKFLVNAVFFHRFQLKRVWAKYLTPKKFQVRGLPCAHNFHVECIDEWLRLNVKCPRCRCSVFPNLDLSALSNLRPESERSPASIVTTNRYVQTQQPSSQSYLLRLHGFLRPVRSENAGPPNSNDVVLEISENGHVAAATQERANGMGLLPPDRSGLNGQSI